MTRPDSPTLQRRAQQLRREELARIAAAIDVEWSTFLHRTAGAIASGLAQWHAHARNLRLD